MLRRRTVMVGQVLRLPAATTPLIRVSQYLGFDVVVELDSRTFRPFSLLECRNICASKDLQSNLTLCSNDRVSRRRDASEAYVKSAAQSLTQKLYLLPSNLSLSAVLQPKKMKCTYVSGKVGVEVARVNTSPGSRLAFCS